MMIDPRSNRLALSKIPTISNDFFWIRIRSPAFLPKLAACSSPRRIASLSSGRNSGLAAHEPDPAEHQAPRHPALNHHLVDMLLFEFDRIDQDRGRPRRPLQSA